jgi:hypothetical protein
MFSKDLLGVEVGMFVGRKVCGFLGKLLVLELRLILFRLRANFAVTKSTSSRSILTQLRRGSLKHAWGKYLEKQWNERCI